MEWCAIFNWHFYAAQNNNTKKYDSISWIRKPIRLWDRDTKTVSNSMHTQTSEPQHIKQYLIQKCHSTIRSANNGKRCIFWNVHGFITCRELKFILAGNQLIASAFVTQRRIYLMMFYLYICIRKIFVNGVAIWFEPISIYLITKYQHQEPPYRKKWSNVLFQQANKKEKRTLVYDIHW